MSTEKGMAEAHSERMDMLLQCLQEHVSFDIGAEPLWLLSTQVFIEYAAHQLTYEAG
jgi:hypothetical protein